MPTGHPTDICGAKAKSTGQPCGKSAGWGTNHLGVGHCSLHGGSTPTHGVAAAREQAERVVSAFGLSRKVDPAEALLEEIWRAQGAVDFAESMVVALDPQAVVWGQTKKAVRTGFESGTTVEEQAAVNLWVQIWQDERKHLAKISAEAIRVGIEVRRVKLAEDTAQKIVAVLQGVFADLGLSEAQQALLPEVVPRHLRSVRTG